MSTTQVEQVRNTQRQLQDQLQEIRQEASRVEQEPSYGYGGPDPQMVQEWTSLRYELENFAKQQHDQAEHFAEKIRSRSERIMSPQFQQQNGHGGSTGQRSVYLVRRVVDVCEQLLVAQATLLEEISGSKSGTTSTSSGR